jgi:GntR family transcriptional regulator, sialic acid-inducible nan operon repressor
LFRRKDCQNGNSIFTAIHAAIVEWLVEQRRSTLANGEDVKAFEVHKKIFDAISARDPDAAERAMRAHLEHVARRYAENTCQA